MTISDCTTIDKTCSNVCKCYYWLSIFFLNPSFWILEDKPFQQECKYLEHMFGLYHDFDKDLKKSQTVYYPNYQISNLKMTMWNLLVKKQCNTDSNFYWSMLFISKLKNRIEHYFWQKIWTEIGLSHRKSTDSKNDPADNLNCFIHE